jgi:hypothetical protein
MIPHGEGAATCGFLFKRLGRSLLGDRKHLERENENRKVQLKRGAFGSGEKGGGELGVVNLLGVDRLEYLAITP